MREKFGLRDAAPVLRVAGSSGWVFPQEMGRKLGRRILPLIPSAYAETARAFGRPETDRALALAGFLRTNKRIIAPFVHVDIEDFAATGQILETAAWIVEMNQAKAHYVVLITDGREAVERLRSMVRAYLERQYPESAQKRNEIYSRLPIFASTDTVLSSFIPGGAVTAWVDWPETGEDSGRVPDRARETQVYANQLVTGGRIPFDEKNRGFGASLLQAVTLLLRGPGESGLGASKDGRYRQTGLDSFLSFGRLLEALQRITASA